MGEGNIDTGPCVFCALPANRLVQSNATAIAIRDAYPVSPGHSLIIPKRHIGSFFEVSSVERADLMALLASMRALLNAELNPEAYNIGINDGPQAGQTVPHMHMHLIPRFVGDVADPRGGVRWILPAKAKYWRD
ncbi:MAG: HIT domain-containing protein [Gammaproteobacteria bacterium]|jgi:diadenosine tetraphosphate (Ap4A) HIT family hydrolase|nr:HIT domain-containing protein [Gammaproteobacteria bacterium]MBK7171550.1 HIT domain-containing protein [Gammaproteobacteria bacterium]MBK7521642.1 HIT domain-containing protein [Gammaproteobacteria bacterium]MBK7729417.1 HIT domain-containing protein [Gammaproteobacteria bacterium]MBK9668284.1 HIT domain-containing protein [Gammaproteobacteria bacterium]